MNANGKDTQMRCSLPTCDEPAVQMTSTPGGAYVVGWCCPQHRACLQLIADIGYSEDCRAVRELLRAA